MKKSILFLVSLLLLGTSCGDDFFELKREVNPPILTVSDMERAVAGAYYAMTGNSGNQSNFDVITVMGAAISDEASFNPLAGNNPQVSEFYNRQNASDNGIANSAFIASYKGIAQCNQWLPVLEANSLAGLTDSDELPRMRGELYFLRAYNYYILTKLFAVPYTAASNNTAYFPLRLAAPAGLEDANAPAAPANAVYDAMVNDLRQAISFLPADPTGQFPSYQHGRANKFAAMALLSRIFLQMGRLDEALDLCNEIITTGTEYSLAEAPIEAWNKPWSGGSKSVIWYYAIGDTPASNGLGGSRSNWKLPRRYSMFNYSILSNNASSPGSPPGGNMRTTDRSLSISDALLRKAGWMNDDRTPTSKALNDLRFTQLVQYNAGTDPIFAGLPTRQYWVNKYWRGPQSEWRAGAIPLIRLAEVYLTRAYIRFTKGDTQGAADDLNAVRQRAWNAVAAGAEYTPLTAGEVTADLIHTERMIELMFEGDRLYYLQGLKQPVPNGDRGEGTVAFDNASLFWPIPVRERELNQGL